MDGSNDPERSTLVAGSREGRVAAACARHAPRRADGPRRAVARWSGASRARTHLLGACARRRDPNVGAEAPEIRGVTPRRLERFVEIGLLEVVDAGYVISEWEGYFPRDFTAAERQRRCRERAEARRRRPALTPPLSERLTGDGTGRFVRTYSR
jgi:hypothetical protein